MAQASITKAVFVLLIVAGTSRIQAAESGVNRWSPFGPPGVSVVRVAIDAKSPLTVYASGGPAGLYRSTDGGATWSRIVIDSGANPSITDVSVDPTNSSVLFAAGTQGGLFRTTDGGATWIAVGVGLPSESLPIVISASQPATVYLGSYRSLDRGATFSKMRLPNLQNLQGVLVDPKNASTLFAFFLGGREMDGGLFKSTDGGDNWFDTRVTAQVERLTIDPVNPAILYASDWNNTTFKTSDGGATWATIPVDHPLTEIVVDPAAPSILYTLIGPPVRLVRSADGGASWQPLPDVPPQDPLLLSIDPTGLRLYLVSLGEGAFVRRSEDRPLSLLHGRFQVSMDARDPRTGRVTVGVAIPQSDRFGFFSLPEFTGDASFPEVVVKMSDATSLPALGGTFWFFHAPLTDVEYTLTVTDTVTGATRTYRNASSGAGELCGGVDTSAFGP